MTTNTAYEQIRHDWRLSEIQALFEMPLNDLLFLAQSVHRQNFDPNTVQVSRLLSIKTGACPEDCKYCAQSGHNQAELEKEKLLEVASVVEAARKAKEEGASRFCMGAAWRCPRDMDMPYVLEMVREVKALGMETCMTLGMLTAEQAKQLGDEGLDYYNHNLDTSESYYDQIITTRTYQDRLDTLQHVRDAGMKICSGGILGMGESTEDRAGLLMQLANLPEHPESVPINMLIRIPGTPLADEEDLDPFEFVRTVAVARIMMPRSWVRLSAGRESMNDQMQALCYFAGANSVFCGDKLLTTGNKAVSDDISLFERLGMKPLDTELDAERADRDMEVLTELKRSAENELFFNAME
jgi:biotin synthase